MRQNLLKIVLIGIWLSVLMLPIGGYAEDSERKMPSEDEFVPLDKIPQMVTQVAPEYPEKAREEKITGKVYIKALIDKNGDVIKVKVAKSSGNELLDKAAVKAAGQNKYKPGEQDGQPVAAWVTYAVSFVLDDEEDKTEKD